MPVVRAVVAVVLMLTPWAVLYLGARRFERKRRRQGAWNKSGPIDPTYGEPNPALRAMWIDVPSIPSHTEPPDEENG